MKYQHIQAFEQALSPSIRIYLVQIPSDQERADVLQTMIRKIAKENPTLERFSGGDVDCRALFDALVSPPLFGGEALVVVDECEALKKATQEKIGEFLEKNSIAGYLILSSKGKTPLAKVVEKLGAILDMSEEKPWEKEKRVALTLSDMAKKEGKWLSSEAGNLLIEKVGSDLALLSQELRKLICFVGMRPNIERSDIFRLCSNHTNETPWSLAEEIIWEGKGTFEPSLFVPLIFALRAQLQLGKKILSLMEEKVPSSEWSPYFPKVWPKTLEKRREQAMKRGSVYFDKGLEMLFKIESLSRASSDPSALFDLFRAHLVSYVR